MNKSADSSEMLAEDDVIERSLAGKVLSYGQALDRWVAAGQPVRTDEDVERIYSTLCEPCAYFNRCKHYCKICGCQVRSHGSPFTNKIRMGSEHCPKEKW